jgi:hypothetical protein
LLIIYLLFEKDYFDIRKINNNTTIFDNIYSLFSEILENGNKLYDIDDIKEYFSISKFLVKFL